MEKEIEYVRFSNSPIKEKKRGEMKLNKARFKDSLKWKRKCAVYIFPYLFIFISTDSYSCNLLNNYSSSFFKVVKLVTIHYQELIRMKEDRQLQNQKIQLGLKAILGYRIL